MTTVGGWVDDAPPTTTAGDRPNHTDRRTVTTIQRELEKLARRHSHLLALGDDNDTTTRSAKAKTRSRKKALEARHADREFHGNYPDDDDGVSSDGYYLSLFDEFARMVCHAGVIPRKELFEAWAMALYVHFYFPPSPEDDDDGESPSAPPGVSGRNYYKRVADMGCGHGLVSWAILFLDQSRTRTAICIDKSIPKSCDIVERVVTKHHPRVAEFDKSDDPESSEEKKEEATGDPIEPPIVAQPERATTRKRWHWVEGDICRNVSADPSTLIVGVHCCGTLSDTILDMAISSGSALALVPCCHTRKSLPREYHQQPQKVAELLAKNAKENEKLLNETEQRTGTSPPQLLPTTLTDCVDRYRIQKLTDAGFDVREELIPSVITPKNRIIVATPPPLEDVSAGDAGGDGAANESEAKPSTSQTEKGTRDFQIPLADNPSARSIVASQSGRIAADLRKRGPPPNLSLSLYLPEPETSMTPGTLNDFANGIAREEQHKHYPGHDGGGLPLIVTHVEYGRRGPFHHPEEGRFSRSYRIQYEVNDPTGKLPQITRAQAKAVHAIVCRRIEENAFPGIALRQGMKHA